MAQKTQKTPASKPKSASAPARGPKPAARAKAGKRPAEAPATKAARVLEALHRSSGATLPDLITMTGWQAHSVRGFLSGTVKKRLGHELTSEGTGAGRVYKIVGTRAA